MDFAFHQNNNIERLVDWPIHQIKFVWKITKDLNAFGRCCFSSGRMTLIFDLAYAIGKLVQKKENWMGNGRICMCTFQFATSFCLVIVNTVRQTCWMKNVSCRLHFSLFFYLFYSALLPSRFISLISTFLSFVGPIVSIMNKKKNKNLKNKSWNVSVDRIRSMCQMEKWNKQREGEIEEEYYSFRITVLQKNKEQKKMTNKGWKHRGSIPTWRRKK